MSNRRYLSTWHGAFAVLFVWACGGEAPATGPTTTPDETAPTVQSVNPADAATGVARNVVVTVTFSEAIIFLKMASACSGT